MVRPQGVPVPVRAGAATVELAVLLPFLAFLFVIAVDYSRIFYYSVTITNCARNGAVWACDPVGTPQSPYTSVEQAALADAQNLAPMPAVASTTGVDGNGQSYVEVTVTYTFRTITRYPGVPTTTMLSRSVRMRAEPVLPSF